MSILYLVSTPIGNMQDITIRAIETLWQVSVILCEDTRRTGKILAKYQRYQKGEKPKLLSYTDYNRDKRIPQIVEFLKQGQTVALVSNAGTPLISDPGYKLVKAVIQEGESDSLIKVVAIPGANAILTALQVSGFPPDRFCFVGFVPRKSLKRLNFFKGLPNMTVVAFESPHRLIASLTDLKQVYGKEMKIAVCLEMTKLYESVFRGTVDDAIASFNQGKIKGELTLVFCPSIMNKESV